MTAAIPAGPPFGDDATPGTRSTRLLPDLAGQVRLYETILSAHSDLGDGVVLIDGERFVFVNDAFCRLTGFTRNELTSPEFRIEHLWAPEERERMAERRARRLAGDVPEEHYEVVIQPLRGPNVHCEVSVKRVEHPGRSLRFALVRDVTERKRAQAELEAARSEMAHSEKLAALGALVSGVAHEVRTPLVYVQNSAYLLSRSLRREAEGGRLSPEARDLVDECVARIGEGVDRVNRLVRDLSRYARVSSTPAPCRLDEVVRDAIEIHRATHLGTGIELRADLRRVPTLVLDEGKIQQAVLNLLQNATDAMPRGGCIRVSTHEAPDGVRLVVRDDGPGIAPAARDRLFEPFYTTKQEGMGLGLSIVRRIVEMHHGRIGCESEEGRGTTFTITLPLPDAEPEAAADWAQGHKP